MIRQASAQALACAFVGMCGRRAGLVDAGESATGLADYGDDLP